MADFFAELKRRHIYRVGAAYVVVAWVFTQAIGVLSQVYTLPLWIAQAAIALMALGLPVALFIAWTIESKPHQAVASAVRSKPTIVDWTLVGALALVVLMIGYQQLAPSRQAGVEDARTASLNPSGSISLAVLPFTNLSSDAEQEFFSDGITEEITGALAKVPDLRVVARTSAFEFKGQNRNIQTIGQQLKVTHLIEGSVRKAGDRVRITAQLINATDGTHLWSENYDRELTDIFTIQEDIARAITASLRMPLGLKPGENLVNNRGIDPEAYQQYLRAKALVRLRARGVPQAIEILEPLVARNRDHAPAWALLGQAYGLTPLYRRTSVDALRSAVQEFLPEAEAAAQRAIQLDPNLPDGYRVMAGAHARRGNLLATDDLARKALDLDPNDPDTLNGYSNLLAFVGRIKEALALKQQLRALEPFVPSFNLDVAEVLWLDGQTDAATAMLKETPLGGAKIDLATIYASGGRYNEAADVLLEINPELPNQPLRETITEAVRLLRSAPARATSPQSLPRLSTLAFAYLHVGAPERFLEPYEEWAQAGFFVDAGINFAWHPSYAPLRKLERFKAYAVKAGLVEYWRAKGWPEFCRPVGAEDFQCE